LDLKSELSKLVFFCNDAAEKYTDLFFLASLFFFLRMVQSGNKHQLNGRLSTIDLLIKVACLKKILNNVYIIKKSCSQLVNAWRSTVLNLPLQ
jgi:hypothetical protein